MENIVPESALLPQREDFYDSIYCEKCQHLLKEPCWIHATICRDAHVVPLSITSLPDVLCFGGSRTENGVFAKTTIHPHTVFGPLVAAPRISSEIPARTVRDSSVSEKTLAFNMDDDKWCNWMKHVTVVRNSDEQNMKIYLLGEEVIFVSVKVILPGEELRLAVGHHWALRACGISSRRITLGDMEILPRGCRNSGIQDNVPLPVFVQDPLTSAEDSCKVKIELPASSNEHDENGLPWAREDNLPCTVVKDDFADFNVCRTVLSVDLDSVTDLSVPSVSFSGGEECAASCGSSQHRNERESSPEYPFPPLRPFNMSTMIAPCQHHENEAESSKSPPQSSDLGIRSSTYLPVSESADDQQKIKIAAGITPHFDGPVDKTDSHENTCTVDATICVDNRDKVCTLSYSLRPRTEKTAITHTGHSEQRKRSLHPVEKAPDDDSDVDVDWLVSDTGRESSTESDEWLDSAPPTKKSKSSRPRSEKKDTKFSLKKENSVKMPPIVSGEKTDNVDVLNKSNITPGTHDAETLETNASIRSKSDAYRGWRGIYASDVYRFKCPECSLHFRHDLLLQWHRQFQHASTVDDPWVSRRKCSACIEVYVVEEAMVRHVEQHGVEPSRIKHFVPTDDPSIMRYIPDDCGSAVVLDGFPVNHETHGLCFMHHAEECCKYGCTLRFCSEALMDVHKMKHIPPKNYEGPLVCPACQYQADSFRTLVDHADQHGAARRDRKMCWQCAEFVTNMNYHAAHTHKEEYERFMSVYFTFACDQCEKRCKTSGYLKAHKGLKHRARVSQCYICAKQFPRTILLKEHSEEHRTEAGLVCPTCQRSFQSYGKFSRHTKSHNPKHISICDVCQAVFADPSQLNEHKRIHETDYKYHCDQCEKSFKRTCNLWQHKKQVHSDFYRKKRKERKEERQKKGIVVKYVCPRRTMLYEEYPFKCEVCRLGWLKLGALEQHKLRKHAGSDA